MKKLLIYLLLIISSIANIYCMEEKEIDPVKIDEHCSFDHLPAELKEYIINLTVDKETDIGKLVKKLLLVRPNKECKQIIEGGQFWKAVFINYFKNVLNLDISAIMEQIQGSKKVLEKIKEIKEGESQTKELVATSRYTQILFRLFRVYNEPRPEKRKLDISETVTQINGHLEKILKEAIFYFQIRKIIKESKFHLFREILDDITCMGIEQSWVNRLDVNVNIQDGDGRTALMHASYYGINEAIVKLLLDSGAHINIQDKRGSTALMFAANRGNLRIVKLLLASGANINVQCKSGDTALILAAADVWPGRTRSHLEIVKHLLNSGADVNVQNKKGWTALMHVADKGHLDIVKDLLKAGADVNLQNEKGWTVLMHVVDKGYLDIVKDLLKAGANVNLQNKDGCTSLMIAASKGHENITDCLLENGADMTMKNNAGKTALQISVARLKKR